MYFPVDDSVIPYLPPKHYAPELFEPGKKPASQEMEIDWNNPLAKGLTGVWLIGEGTPYNLVTNKLVETTGAPAFNNGGRTFTGSDAYEIPSNIGIDIYDDTSYMAHILYKDVGTAFQHLIGFRNGGTGQGGLRITSAAVVQYFTTAAGGAYGTTDLGVAFADGTPLVISGGHAADDDTRIYLNGALEGTASANIADQALGLYIGNQASLAMPTESTLLIACQWHRILNDAEHASLAANPYQILRPKMGGL